jgi:hypothetical protein
MRLTFAIFAALAACPAFAAEPDYSTPVATVRSYLAATKANDVEAAKLCWGIDDDKESGALDVIVGMRIASRKLVHATQAKFGNEGVKLLGRWDQPNCTDKAIDRTIERLGNITSRELGDVAKVTITWEAGDGDTTPVFLPVKAPLFLRKYGTEWKIDANVFTGEKKAAELFKPGSPWTIWRDEMALMSALTRLLEKDAVKEIGEFEQELKVRVAELKGKFERKE